MTHNFKSLYFFLLLFVTLFAGIINNPVQSAPKPQSVEKILSFDINSSINPATHNYLNSGFEKAKKENFDLILIKLNTPGGLITTTKDILTLFGTSDIPIVVWITPEGASATSAGAIIASGSHVLIMSNGTNIGAATPVQLGKDIDQKDLKNKAINDLVALVQSLSESRGRNEKYFGLMVKEAKSYKASDALKKGLINGIANSQEDLFKVINKSTIILKGNKISLKVSKPTIITFAMDLGQKLLNIFANPSMAYILFLIGAALLYLELQAPGGYIAGSIGALCLVLAGIGFQVLPLNFGGLALIILSFVLFVLEAYITSYGILSLAGIAALVFGSLFLYRTDDSYLAVSNSLIIASVTAVVAFLVFIFFFLVRDMQKMRRQKKNFYSLIGKTGVITEELPKKDDSFVYYVRVSGETWKTESKEKLELGKEYTITAQDNDNMILKI